MKSYAPLGYCGLADQVLITSNVAKVKYAQSTEMGVITNWLPDLLYGIHKFTKYKLSTTLKFQHAQQVLHPLFPVLPETNPVYKARISP